MSLNTSFSLVSPVTDSGGNPSTQLIGSYAYDIKVGTFNPDQSLPDTNALALTLPAATCLSFYVKNTSPVANLTVTWTKAAGGTGVQILAPGGMILCAEPAGGSGGITALQVQSDTAVTPFEWFASA